VTLSKSQRDWLKKATSQYHQALAGSQAAEHLEARSLSPEKISKFRLGAVSEPEPGHEAYAGRLAIPYLRRSITGDWTVVTIRFRCVQDHECKREKHGKYLDMPGELGKPRLFNTVDAIDHQDWICITEGELDAVAASSNGIPAVGVSGATKWLDHWSEVFEGYDTVYVLADGDTAGSEFGKLVSSHLNNSRTIPMDPGDDVNSMIQKYGVEKITERIGR
jgi:DNA primase